ncbi:TetR/AcrR family transcriptional regulator [Streptomyces sp. BI20]|uniref:TetR/AcrR family transcriptional regulator n=1 Tax=Streptomyces sp. BI20 TaxID=3403460 RepID=UPI003C741AE6
MPRNTLTLEQIASTAIELLDDEGLEGLNMRSLGKRLGSAPTAVYWHVKNKDDLVVLVGDRVWEEVALPEAEAPDWREPAEALATGLYELFGRHPWLVQAMGSHVFYGPAKARYDDRILEVFEVAGFTGPQADLAATAVFTFVLGNAVTAAATGSLHRRLGRDGSNVEEALARMMEEAAEVAAAHPRIRARLDSPVADYNGVPDGVFEHGLRALLHGLEAARRAAP